MPEYFQAAQITWQGNLLGQNCQWQVTISPSIYTPFSDIYIASQCNQIYDQIAKVEALSGTLGSDFAGFTPTQFEFQSIDIYLMQGGLNPLFFRKTYPINVSGFRTSGGTEPSQSYDALSFSSAPTVHRRQPASFRLPGVLEADSIGNEFVFSGPGLVIVDEIKNQLNAGWSIDFTIEDGGGGSETIIANFVTSCVQRLRILQPDGSYDYYLPSLPGDPVSAQKVDSWAWNQDVGTQLSRKKRRLGA